MAQKTIHITEQDVREIVNEALNELDWKTYMNAARKHNSHNPDKAHEMEKLAQQAFMRQHGMGGHPYNYEGDSPDYMGRRHYFTDKDFELHGDKNFQTKNPTDRKWIDDETGEQVKTRQYRHGVGIPHMNYGQVFDDTAEITDADSFNGVHQRRHTFNYTKDGERYNPELSSVGDEVSVSRDPKYNRVQDTMRKDMKDYYTGKARYTTGKGWTSEQKIKDIVSKVIKEAHDYWNDTVDNYLMQERLPKGWDKNELEDGTVIYTDQDYNQYTKDEYGKFVPLGGNCFNEKKVHNAILGAIKRLNESNELYDEWYEVEDYDGNTGNPGEHRSYELGHSYVDSAIEDAKESGYDNLEDYLFFWLDEVKDGLPWYWSNDNAYKGDRLFTHDGFVFYDLYGQLILEEYPIADARRDQASQNKLEKGE